MHRGREYIQAVIACNRGDVKMAPKSSSGRRKSGGKSQAPAQATGTVPQAKTIAEANQLAVNLGLVQHADFTGLDVSAANEMMSELDATYKMFPNLPHLVFIGSIQNGINWAHDEVQREKFFRDPAKWRRIYPGLSDSEVIAKIQVSKHRVDSKAWAWFASGNYSTGHYDVEYIGLNTQHYSSSLLSDTLSHGLPRGTLMRFHPEHCGTIRSVISHEIGHYLDYRFGIEKDSSIRKIFRAYREKGVLRDTGHGIDRYFGRMAEALSEYANTNRREFIAEAWAEYRNNPNPRSLAKQVGDRIIEIVRGRNF